MKKMLLLLFVLVLIVGCSNTYNNDVKKISSTEVYNNITTGKYIVIDVREKDEYASGHIQNAINISVDDLSNDILDIVVNKNTNIVVYCRSGARSLKSAENLINLGYTNVYDMGGILDWTYELVK